MTDLCKKLGGYYKKSYLCQKNSIKEMMTIMKYPIGIQTFEK